MYPHKVHVSREEVEEILKWSDNEDMETAQGRFRHRQKTQAGYDTTHDTQFFMKEGDQGAVTDVSKGPRSILKKLLRPATGYQNPVEGFEVDIVYTAHAAINSRDKWFQEERSIVDYTCAWSPRSPS